MRRFAAIALLAFTYATHAQWQLQQSQTTASLRGIHALGNGVAWASGTGGTVLRTVDDGATWQPCAIPPAAEHLDFRGIQAFDAKTAIVMSSGKGDLSRLYKTTDACQTWKLVFTNPDKEGFWDAILLNRYESDGWLFGDPVNGQFAFWTTKDKGATWQRDHSRGLTALTSEGAFAASNSSMIIDDHLKTHFGSGSAKQVRFFTNDSPEGGYEAEPIPMASGSPGAGIFSLASRTFLSKIAIGAAHFVAVGGDYTKADDNSGTAAFSVDDGHTWQPATTPPHGYRSAVAYSPTHKAWITVGPNGTDLSTDDGRTWRPLRPTAPNADPEEDQHWNALSLPFVVGPKGRIGKLRAEAIQDALRPAK